MPRTQPMKAAASARAVFLLALPLVTASCGRGSQEERSTTVGQVCPLETERRAEPVTAALNLHDLADSLVRWASTGIGRDASAVLQGLERRRRIARGTIPYEGLTFAYAAAQAPGKGGVDDRLAAALAAELRVGHVQVGALVNRYWPERGAKAKALTLRAFEFEGSQGYVTAIEAVACMELDVLAPLFDARPVASYLELAISTETFVDAAVLLNRSGPAGAVALQRLSERAAAVPRLSELVGRIQRAVLGE